MIEALPAVRAGCTQGAEPRSICPRCAEIDVKVIAPLKAFIEEFSNEPVFCGFYVKGQIDMAKQVLERLKGANCLARTSEKSKSKTSKTYITTYKVVCAWCGKVLKNSSLCGEVSHGICLACKRKEIAKLFVIKLMTKRNKISLGKV